ncbi:MAG: Rne/Rng family ribonuclease [Candidatus Nanopelagicaceae bacterium]|nr:Rne/Rng family ribonuclease [Candidatus Nanopelagicaceae bacterium]
MAIEPKTPRKRAAKKVAQVPVENVEPVAKKTPGKKNAPAIPVPIFQAALVAQAKSARVSRDKAPTEELATESVVKKATSRKKAVPAVLAVADAPEAASSSADLESRGRRRRRGGRGRRRPNEIDGESTESDASGDSESEKSATHRRRRRRSSVDGVTPGETVEEDGVITVVKVREPREPREVRERPARGAARDRAPRRTREPRSEYRESYRKRGTIITESEFLARRENVDREMLVRQIGDRTQICVIEDKIMVEHYVNRHTNVSYVGNVYLGRVQNVLPSMEAAFVDIGKGRNAVLYAAEVNWDAAGISEAQPRKIEMVLKTGQPVLVQVTKDPIGQKGARLTGQISLPGRYLVYVPGGGMSGISRRLPEPERARLKSVLKAIVPEESGVIVRTAAEGTSDVEIEADVARLKTQWDDIVAKSENPNFQAPALLYSEPDLAVRVIRDIFNEDFRKLTIQGSDAWEEINNYLGFIAPELTSKIEKWTGPGDLFTDYRIDEQLAKAFDRKVYLPSGGSLVIDRTEAMIVIDVNTGKFIGKGGSLEETVTKNNLEAAEEISRQLRLRDLGGIIVIDFIDMILESNRELVLRRLVECLGRDRTKHQVAEVTSLGLVQMTRKRVGQGLIEAFSTTCETCGGRGIHIQTDPVKARPSLPFGGQNGLGNVHDAIEHEVSEIEVTEIEVDEEYEAIGELEVAEMPHIVTPEPAKGRRRRRAASSGVITPGA